MSSLRFTIKPTPVFPEHRPLYKIAQLVLILKVSSRGGRSSLAKLQLFNWALKKKERGQRLADAADSGQLSVSGWGFDPAVPIALRFAIADGLIDDVSTGYSLTTDGERFARAVTSAGLLPDDLALLQQISKKITEGMVNDVAKRWEA